MVETSARLLRLLTLLQARREWSGALLAARLGVSERTVRRDVERLRGLGYPVHSVTGTLGGYQLGAGAELPPLLLDDEEAVAVVVGLRSAVGAGVEGIEESSVRALTKLEQVLPHRLRRRVSALSSYSVPMRRPATGPVTNAATLTELAHACRDQQQLRFSYETHNGESTPRIADPYRLVSAYRRWYLVAWDVHRQDWRTFRVDRITLTPPHGARFAPRTPPATDVAAYVADGISSVASAVRASVVLRTPLEEAAGLIEGLNWTLEPVDDDSCLLRAESYSLETLAGHLLFLGVDFTIREPAELTGQIRALRDRMNRTLALTEQRNSGRDGDEREPSERRASGT